MTMRSLRATRGAARAGALALLLLTAACGIFEGEERIAEKARVVVSGETTVPLELVASTKFIRTRQPEGQTDITLLQADTFQLTLENVFDQEFPVKPDRGFFVRLRNYDTIPALVSMQVYFDGELTYDQQNVTLQQAYLEFSFIFYNESYIQ